MITLSPRWRAAGAAALFLLAGWACNCGAFQQLAAGGPGADQPAEEVTVEVEDPPLPPATELTQPADPAEAPPAEAGPLFEDDFSDPNTGWYLDDSEEGSYAYVDGVYAVTAQTQDLQMWGNAGHAFGDVTIEVDATQVSAPANDNNAYGVGCRVQENGDGYYLRISGDGYYAIFRVSNDPETDEAEFVTVLDWTASEAINQGSATNHITVTCEGPDLRLSVNGEVLGSGQDGMYATGDIALTATTFEPEPTTIHYDNLVVREP